MWMGFQSDGAEIVEVQIHFLYLQYLYFIIEKCKHKQLSKTVNTFTAYTEGSHSSEPSSVLPIK